jgi:hypothetical protein
MSLLLVVILACICIIAFLLSSRTGPADSRSSARLALLHGVRPIWGESQESLRNRTTAASRWPYSHPDPEFVWWARVWRRAVGAFRHG